MYQKIALLTEGKKERSVVVGAMHLLATSWAMLGALGFVEFKLGGELQIYFLCGKNKGNLPKNTQKSDGG